MSNYFKYYINIIASDIDLNIIADSFLVLLLCNNFLRFFNIKIAY